MAADPTLSAATEYDRFVIDRLAAGDDPNKITSEIENALAGVPGWALWGDGEWRRDV